MPGWGSFNDHPQADRDRTDLPGSIFIQICASGNNPAGIAGSNGSATQRKSGGKTSGRLVCFFADAPSLRAGAAIVSPRPLINEQQPVGLLGKKLPPQRLSQHPR